MKKLLLLVALAFAGAGAYAQINQGTMMLGGSVFFKSADFGAGSESVFGLDVNGSYFLMENIAVGGRIGFVGEDKGGLATGQKSRITIGVTGRKYFNLADKFYAFAGVGIGYAIAENIAGGDVSELYVNATPGFAWFPTEKWAIHMSLGDWIYFRSGTGTSSFGIEPSIGGLGLGVNYVLGK